MPKQKLKAEELNIKVVISVKQGGYPIPYQETDTTGPRDINNGDNDLKRKQHPDHGRKKTSSIVHPCGGACLTESHDLLGVGCVSLEPEKDHPSP